MGLEPGEEGALYYVSTLAWVGCVADTPEVAAMFGDDIALRRDSYEVDFSGLPMLGFMLRHVGAGTPALHRLRLGAKLILTGGKEVERGLMSHCLTTARMAERFGLDECVHTFHCHAVRHATRPARHARTPRSVGGTPDDGCGRPPYRPFEDMERSDGEH